jgi:4-hydroxymandelate oxidase
MQPLNLREFEGLAAAQIAQPAWDYYRSGACDEITLRRNEQAFDEIALRYRVLVDVSQRSTAARVLGRELALPVLVAPTAFHKLAHADGEVATARAAAQANTIMVLSTLSNTPVEEVVAAYRSTASALRSDAAHANTGVWFQLYVYRDRGATRALCERVQAAGCAALVLTVDAPLLGRRERDVRNRFNLPDGLHIANAFAAESRALHPGIAESGLFNYFSQQLDASLNWKDIEWLRSISPLPLLIKGIVRGDDARRARDHGATGVIVSNHGGRQLDTSLATIEALPEVAEALGGARSFPILLDGGVRRGTDVLKALALGAEAVLLGRPILWGLAAGGQQGVCDVLELLRRELDLAQALCGYANLAEVGRDLVAG